MSLLLKAFFARSLCANNLATCVSSEVRKRIQGIIDSAPSKIVVFMKGTKEQPSCGFSNAVVKILQLHGVQDFSDVNVLNDEEVRNGVKEFSEWPTIPQIYINGAFVGGCDIFLEMHKNGEILNELSAVGITSKLVDEYISSNKGKS